MCGIAGMFRKPNQQALGAMLEALAHRGPDDRGSFIDNRVAIGQTRLSIIDTTSGGHQPMAANKGMIQLVYNGEVYNYREQRKLLESKGYKFETESDTEVVLNLYVEYGDAFLSRLRGIFAIAIYDKRNGDGNERLLLARDHFGIKPLLYVEINGALFFASELKSLLATELVPREVDSEGLRLLLNMGSVYQPSTLVKNVRALPSAHYMVIDKSGSTLKRYWEYGVNRVVGLRELPYEQQVEKFRDALIESVKLQMVADVPVGAFLSGGVDSSLIVALMAKETGGHVKTFSVGFEDGAGAPDETLEAAAMADHLQTDHTRVIVTAADMMSHLDRFIHGLDQPSVDGLNSYFVAHAASQSVTVSLSGTGGDELFLGYPWFAHMNRDFGAVPQPVSPWWKSLFGRRSTTPSDGIDKFREAFGGLYHCFGPKMAYDLMSSEHRAKVTFRSFSEDLSGADEMRNAEPLDRASVLCLNGYTRNQLLRDIDTCAMASSLEVRVPFLDHVLADFALSLPLSSKMAVNTRTLDPGASYSESGVKKILCDVARGYLPETFFNQRSKRGFALPYADWLRGPLAEIMHDTLSRESVIRAGMFNPDMVQKIHSDFLNGHRPWSHPWLLMVTELWRRKVLTAAL
ncbi:asparagine synthase (glutamine-hydrolyzing) [Herbaspirillum sp. RV1423]|uniref:asparagine synthase (glutamine-hydrolyzing) n=1 Tax=Herbaspirillum sp. RV1423 TaxID=1443993 RepID=UPI0004B78E1F|nr:asparagine synthase (glutamine-hydrolyzing) [Herbaspirillum sp. RV1423]